MKKNDLIQVTITDFSSDGLGIGRCEGIAFFIKDTVIGDTVSARIMKMKKNYGYARLEKVLEPSPDRVVPVCKAAGPCGGCQIQSMSYRAQLAFKENKVRTNLEKIGGFEDVSSLMEPIIGMEVPFRYRNKAQFPVGRDKNGSLTAGFYAGHTHSIISCEDCMIGQEQNREIVDIILEHMREFGIDPYNEETGDGTVRHIMTRIGAHTGEIMVCIVVNDTKLPGEEILAEKLRVIPGMTSILLNINREKTNVILGKKQKLIWGKETIKDRIGSVSFSISSKSFFQVNPVQTEKLYGKALEYADLTGKETVWDLYCGIGTISLFLAEKAKQVYGVEIVPEAIEDARINAAENGIKNATFYVGKAEDVLPQRYREENIRADVIIIDPPRKGCDEQVLETMVKMNPDRIVYVSCDSATLARDLKMLCANGYRLVRVCPVDMFGHTVHVETVCLLSKLSEAKNHISVKVDMDEINVTAAESKATYDEIREWVQDNYGFHVTNLNIAQVKRKHGIIERENYNKPKTDESRQPGCPEEKSIAIEEAMRHFQMI